MLTRTDADSRDQQTALTSSMFCKEMAANGQDQGCVEVDFATLPAAIKSLETTVLQIKGAGDKARAEKLKAQFVDGNDDFAKLRQTIAERWLRAPRASFVYSVAM